MTATKTKTKKIETIHPPRDIVENTKARRVWLAAKAEEINALPNRMAKIVGTGSYQSVSVYELIEVEGRERFRGVCQCCGNSQVVDAGVMVLHGYKRPGDGATYGRCPGVAKAPLNEDDSWTHVWRDNAEEEVMKAEAALVAAEARLDAASKALYAGGDVSDGERLETGAWLARPKRPSTRWGQRPSACAQEQYDRDIAVWTKQYPLTHEYSEAQAAKNEAGNTLYNWQRTAEHFNTLLNSGTKGTPLTREVVA